LSGYTVRLIREGEEEDVIDLLVRCLEWPRFDLDVSLHDHYYWKYFDNPGQKGSITVAEAGGKIIGCAHLSYFNLMVSGRGFRGANGTDVAVHPDYRKRGVFNSLTDFRFQLMKEKGIDIAFWSTANPILVQKWRQSGQLFPFNLYDYVKIFDIDKQISRFPMKRGSLVRYGYKILNVTNKLRKRAESNSEDVEIIEVRQFDETRLWAGMSAAYDYMVGRDNEYMNWRYCDPRSGKYVKVLARQGEASVGYAVIAVNKFIDDYPIGYILDIFGSESRVYDGLISYSVKYFEKQDVNLINCLAVNGGGLTKALNRNRFLNSRVKFHLAYNNINGKLLLNTLKPQNTYFCFGDRDSLPTQTNRN